MVEIARHRRGGGRLFGIDGAVSSDTLIDSRSEVHGRSFVSFMSEIRNNSIVMGGNNGTSVACSVVDHSFVADSHLSYAKVTGSSLNDVIVRGTYEPARLENMILSNGVVVEGCRLSNFELALPVLIHSDWDHEPRHFSLKEYGVPLNIIECRCRPGIHSSVIGCKCRPTALWIERKEILRRAMVRYNRWRPQIVDLIHDYFKLWLRTPSL